MALADQLNVARKLAAAAGTQLSEADLLRLSGVNPYPTSDAALLDNSGLCETLVRGFLYLAANGESFVAPSEIKAHFGRTLAENYPEANDTFLRFATTYWTYRVWLDDQVDDELMGGNLQQQPLVARLLRTLEVQIAGLFFPTPGSVTVPPDKREAAQRELLENFRVPLDVSAFIAGNSILIRDRAQGSGCLRSAAILAALFLGIVLLVIFII